MPYVTEADRFNRACQALDKLEREAARLRHALDASRELELASTWFPERRDGERRDGVERRSSDRRRAGESQRA
jgi:hypothetical protein